MTKISEARMRWDADAQLEHCQLLSEDGESISFWSTDFKEALNRRNWIEKAYDAPFIIEDDQE